MVKYPSLPNAPITEAVIAIRVRGSEDFDVNGFSALHDVISGQYPKKDILFRLHSKFELEKIEGPVMLADKTVEGCIFTSEDGKQIFQAKRDSFAFHRLRPYEKWETFRDEAVRLWNLYRDLSAPEIFRVALRYINKLDIPLLPGHTLDFNEYLTAGPVVPSGLPQGVSSFLTRVVIEEPAIDSSAIITQTLEQGVNHKFVSIILDIDVFRERDIVSEKEAWQALEKMRRFKNRIFFESITEKSTGLFQ